MRDKLLERDCQVEKSKKSSECIVFCKKVTPYLFEIKRGFAVVTGPDESFNDGICMIASTAKIVFVFE